MIAFDTSPNRANLRCLAPQIRAVALAVSLLPGLSACLPTEQEQPTLTVVGPSQATPSETEISREELLRDRALVVRLQQHLRAAGHDPGPVDGLIGPKTIGSIKAYRQANGQTFDGRITRRLLAEIATAAAAHAAATTQSAALADGDAQASSSPVKPVVVEPRQLAGSRYLYSDGTILEIAAAEGEQARRRPTRGQTFGDRREFLVPPLSWWSHEEDGKHHRGHSQSVAKTDENWHCRRGGREVLTVVAGRFATEKLICDRLTADRSIDLVRTWYYAPSLRHYVRRLDVNASGSNEPPVDLVAIQPAVNAWPPAAQAGLSWATQHALDSLPSGKEQPWRSSAVAPSVVIRPGDKIDWYGQGACRRYQQIWTVDREDWVFPTVACRDASGGWIFPGLPDSNRVAKSGTIPNP